MNALEVEWLDVPFGAAPGLRGITFAVAAGERFVLVGASGAGKTSLLAALAGEVRPSAGRVRIAGKDVTEAPVQRRPSVLLAQTPLLFPHLDVFENVAFPLRVARIPAREVVNRVEAVLAAVRMTGFETRLPSTLSGGQARRVALARAVVSRPPVLLLDEPLSALDPSLRDEVRNTILSLHADYRPALVMVTHDLAEAGRLADRIGVLVEGGLAQVGTPEAVFRRPATLAVARFLGLPNELDGSLDQDGCLRVAGTRIPGTEKRGPDPGAPDTGGASGPSSVRVVFGTDGGALLERGVPSEGAVAGRVARVLHGPAGSTVEVLTDAGRLEVRSAEGADPDPGTAVFVRLRPGALHVFER